ncbi:Hypothetical predicted protein [Paramuricea clavata]|uniref:Uncharacterized protein n=1 Tax=Paramuricea clavata TaxID=317549 RepID=A0A6S7FMV9_PARCT|nr:Hypothetical predicted protein [Paramuricea clavata]
MLQTGCGKGCACNVCVEKREQFKDVFAPLDEFCKAVGSFMEDINSKMYQTLEGLQALERSVNDCQKSVDALRPADPADKNSDYIFEVPEEEYLRATEYPNETIAFCELRNVPKKDLKILDQLSTTQLEPTSIVETVGE